MRKGYNPVLQINVTDSSTRTAFVNNSTRSKKGDSVARQYSGGTATGHVSERRNSRYDAESANQETMSKLYRRSFTPSYAVHDYKPSFSKSKILNNHNPTDNFSEMRRAKSTPNINNDIVESEDARPNTNSVKINYFEEKIRLRSMQQRQSNNASSVKFSKKNTTEQKITLVSKYFEPTAQEKNINDSDGKYKDNKRSPNEHGMTNEEVGERHSERTTNSPETFRETNQNYGPRNIRMEHSKRNIPNPNSVIYDLEDPIATYNIKQSPTASENQSKVTLNEESVKEIADDPEKFSKVSSSNKSKISFFENKIKNSGPQVPARMLKTKPSVPINPSSEDDRSLVKKRQEGELEQKHPNTEHEPEINNDSLINNENSWQKAKYSMENQDELTRNNNSKITFFENKIALQRSQPVNKPYSPRFSRKSNHKENLSTLPPSLHDTSHQNKSTIPQKLSELDHERSKGDNSNFNAVGVTEQSLLKDKMPVIDKQSYHDKPSAAMTNGRSDLDNNYIDKPLPPFSSQNLAKNIAGSDQHTYQNIHSNDSSDSTVSADPPNDSLAIRRVDLDKRSKIAYFENMLKKSESKSKSERNYINKPKINQRHFHKSTPNIDMHNDEEIPNMKAHKAKKEYLEPTITDRTNNRMAIIPKYERQTESINHGAVTSNAKMDEHVTDIKEFRIFEDEHKKSHKNKIRNSNTAGHTTTHKDTYNNASKFTSTKSNENHKKIEVTRDINPNLVAKPVQTSYSQDQDESSSEEMDSGVGTSSSYGKNDSVEHFSAIPSTMDAFKKTLEKTLTGRITKIRKPMASTFEKKQISNENEGAKVRRQLDNAETTTSPPKNPPKAPEQPSALLNQILSSSVLKNTGGSDSHHEVTRSSVKKYVPNIDIPEPDY